MQRRAAAVIVLATLAAGCSHGAAPGQTEDTVHVRLAPGMAAQVGEVTIPVSLVADVAQAQRIEPRLALDRLIEDALAAEGARAKGEDRAPSTAWALTSIGARSVSERIRLASRAAGPPTDAEVADLTAQYWRDVDLPEQVKVIHALVIDPKDPSKTDAARALAARLVATLSAAKTNEDFVAAARAIPAAPFDVRVEPLPALVEDGRAAEGAPMPFDQAFVRGAFALRKPGDTSGVIESPFGWHVIRLLERRAPKRLPLEERRARFADEVYARRGRDALGVLLTARRAATPVTVTPSADALMSTITTSAPP